MAGRLDEQDQDDLIREQLDLLEEGAPGRAELLREHLRLYARIIVADLALYHHELVERGIREGSFHRLLGSQIEEARRRYLAGVPPSEAAGDLFDEAVREFVEKRVGARAGGGPGGTNRAGDGL